MVRYPAEGRFPLNLNGHYGNRVLEGKEALVMVEFSEDRWAPVKSVGPDPEELRSVDLFKKGHEFGLVTLDEIGPNGYIDPQEVDTMRDLLAEGDFRNPLPDSDHPGCHFVDRYRVERANLTIAPHQATVDTAWKRVDSLTVCSSPDEIPYNLLT